MAGTEPAPAIDPPGLLTLTESVPALRISVKTAYRWIAEDKFPLPLVRNGRRWMIRRSDLEAYLTTEAETPSS